MPHLQSLTVMNALSVPIREDVPPGEGEEARGLADLHAGKIRKDFEQQPEPRHARRGFHGKSNGIVRATVRIAADLAPSFGRGVFVPGAVYPAWVRFSNGAFAVKPDGKRDVHGLAIKLLGVPDEPRAAQFERHSQDFILIDAPALMIGNVKQALAFDSAMVRGLAAIIPHLVSNLRELWWILRMTSAPRQLFEREYNSVVPFALGADETVRYVVRPAPGQTLREAPKAADNLRASLRAQLEQGDFVLELCLQPRGNSNLPIEDARVPWNTAVHRVATITLHAEGFGTAEQEQLGDRMSFNPWNALEVHRPLGGLNRARRVVYRMVYELRSRLNGQEPFEPRAPEQSRQQ